VSVHIAKQVGQALAAVDVLDLNGIIGIGESSALYRQIRKRAERYGVGVSTRSVAMQPLQNQVRVHWCGSRGQQCNRYYPAFNMPDEREDAPTRRPRARKAGAR
jgi:hypothetical protein